MALYCVTAGSKENKTLNTQPHKNSKGRLAFGFLKGWFTHSKYSMLLQTQIQLKQSEKKRCSNLKNKKKQSSISTQIHEMKLAF